jgi:serine/threonine-protein kinase
MIGADGATLVYVPEGEFTMGSDGNLDEQPVHKINLNAFWIDQNEVTNTLFSAFVDATGYQTDAENLGWSYAWDDLNWSKTIEADWQHPNGADSNILGKEEHPVVQVSWNDAAAYCQWAGRRLPTEAEWEKAARGTDQRDYPWGNKTPNADLLNFLNNIGDTTEVGRYPNGVSPYGAYDMAGNVWEWVNDWYRSDYYAAIEDNAPSPQGPAYGDGRVLRGGSWINYYSVVRSADRNWSNPMFSFSSYGFRCAWGVTP